MVRAITPTPRLPVVWRAAGRAAPDPGTPPERAEKSSAVQVWCSGFIANRHELLAEAGLPEAVGDAEVLATLFQRRGAAAAREIAGTFTWILLDPERGELFAGRDRAGVGSLHYAQSGDRLVIGQRIGEVRSRLARPTTLNMRALVALSHGYAPLPGETCFREIRALEPGAMLLGTASGLRVESYWRLEPRPILRLRTDAEYAEAFRDLLLTVVKQHQPRGPSAVALSSGLDSSAVAATLHAVAPATDLALFCFAMPDLPEADESAGAAAVASGLGQSLTQIRGDRLWPLSNATIPRSLEEGPLVAYRELWDELYRRLRQQRTRVAFTGSGGDHLLGGSGVMLYPDLLLRGSWLELTKQLGDHRRRSDQGWARVIEAHLLRPLARALRPHRLTVATRRMPWLRRKYHRALHEALLPPPGRWRMLPGRCLRLAAMRDRMLPFGLSIMALEAGERGVELRHPLTDHRLVELAASLPLEQCWRAGRNKFVLRNALRGYLPTAQLESARKVLPFALFARGLRERQPARAQELLTDMRAADLGLIDDGLLRLAYERYRQGSGNTLFWHTLVLEDWLRRYA